MDANDPLKEDLTEIKTTVGWLKECGVQLLNVSLGCPYYNPHITRPFESPDEATTNSPSILCWAWIVISASPANCSGHFRICR